MESQGSVHSGRDASRPLIIAALSPLALRSNLTKQKDTVMTKEKLLLPSSRRKPGRAPIVWTRMKMLALANYKQHVVSPG